MQWFEHHAVVHPDGRELTFNSSRPRLRARRQLRPSLRQRVSSGSFKCAFLFLKRIIELSTVRADLVLDSFAGPGTTGAVAHSDA
ncbi:MAG TPA: DNA methyltransferase [Acetobacteraceae bacterium]|nr:DNA methyltransferase [Acetobacteraceae bacterium]